MSKIQHFTSTAGREPGRRHRRSSPVAPPVSGRLGAAILWAAFAAFSGPAAAQGLSGLGATLSSPDDVFLRALAVAGLLVGVAALVQNRRLGSPTSRRGGALGSRPGGALGFLALTASGVLTMVLVFTDDGATGWKLFPAALLTLAGAFGVGWAVRGRLWFAYIASLGWLAAPWVLVEILAPGWMVDIQTLLRRVAPGVDHMTSAFMAYGVWFLAPVALIAVASSWLPAQARGLGRVHAFYGVAFSAISLAFSTAHQNLLVLSGALVVAASAWMTYRLRTAMALAGVHFGTLGVFTGLWYVLYAPPGQFWETLMTINLALAAVTLMLLRRWPSRFQPIRVLAAPFALGLVAFGAIGLAFMSWADPLAAGVGGVAAAATWLAIAYAVRWRGLGAGGVLLLAVAVYAMAIGQDRMSSTGQVWSMVAFYVGLLAAGLVGLLRSVGETVRWSSLAAAVLAISGSLFFAAALVFSWIWGGQVAEAPATWMAPAAAFGVVFGFGLVGVGALREQRASDIRAQIGR